MIKTVRVGSGDPGRFKDSFAFILMEYLPKENVIHVLGAYGWKNIDYPTVEKDIARIHKIKALDFFICESNNTGIHVIESLQKIHGIPVIGITTSNQIKSPEIIRKGRTMDKVEMVGWINNKRQKNQILFPKKKTTGILTLLAQLNSFVRMTTPAGLTTYRAEGHEHDDVAMAFMVGLFYIRRSIIKDFGNFKRFLASKKYEFDSDDIIKDSAIPEGSMLTGSNIHYPMGSMSQGKYKIH